MIDCNRFARRRACLIATTTGGACDFGKLSTGELGPSAQSGNWVMPLTSHQSLLDKVRSFECNPPLADQATAIAASLLLLLLESQFQTRFAALLRVDAL